MIARWYYASPAVPCKAEASYSVQERKHNAFFPYFSTKRLLQWLQLATSLQKLQFIDSSYYGDHAFPIIHSTPFSLACH
jgi:hypothetical protein